MNLLKRPQIVGSLLGVAVSIAVILLFWVWSFAPSWDRATFDWRVRKFSTIPASKKIVHVDIDNAAVAEIGRWPWTRSQIADLLAVTHEAGAKYTFVDLLMSEAERPYREDPSLQPHYMIEDGVEIIGSGDREVYGDSELLKVLRDSANVIMAMELEISPPNGGLSFEDEIRKQLELEGAGTEPPVQDVFKSAGENGANETDIKRRDVWERVQLVRLLCENFALGLPEAAAKLSIPENRARVFWARAKREAARRISDRVLADNPEAVLADVRRAAFGGDFQFQTADTQDLSAAYRSALGERDILSNAVTASADLCDHLYSAHRIVPVLYPLREALIDVAAVNFVADADGVVRRVPPLICADGRIIPHLGVAAAAQILNLDIGSASTSADGRLLSLPRRGGEGAITVPLDGRGNMLIPWTENGERWHEGNDFDHVAAAKLMSVAANRQVIADREVEIQYLKADVIEKISGQATKQTEGQEDVTLFLDSIYRQKVKRLVTMRDDLHREQARVEIDDAKVTSLKSEVERFEKEIAAEQESAAREVRGRMQEIAGIPDEELQVDEGTWKAVKRLRSAAEILDKEIPALEAVNKKIRRQVEELLTELREKIAGKYVFIGFAATAQGDIVPTPIDPLTNGVMCHANVLNAFLQNRFLTPAPISWEISVCLLLVAMVAPFTAIRTPRFALTATVLIAILFGVFSAVLMFQMNDNAMAMVPVFATLFACWSSVTLFRQLTAERDKRLFRGQLSQYTSPAIAARIAESPEAAKAFKVVQTRDMTCYFSDLAGFTTISEQEDAEVIQTVLNVYLERMCETIWSYRGLINKFMGDGIMAIYNPSVDPLDDHARIACESALASVEELEKLKEERKDSPEGRVFQGLHVRIGLATGQCKNGDMGSELKADYTVIGDIVNLAARLEPANKVFGTQIMIAGPTYDRVAEDFDVRYLAELQVKGKAKTVPVYELCGKKNTMSDEWRDYVNRFEAGVALYKARKWDECIVHFTRILSRSPGDLGAARYIDACQEMKAFPPGEGWNGALELKEK